MQIYAEAARNIMTQIGCGTLSEVRSVTWTDQGEMPLDSSVAGDNRA